MTLTSTLKAIYQVLGHPYHIKFSSTEYPSHFKIFPIKRPLSTDFHEIRGYFGPNCKKLNKNVWKWDASLGKTEFLLNNVNF